jgi:hypothetical protein
MGGKRPVLRALCHGPFIVTFIAVPRGDIQGSGGEPIKVAMKFAIKALMVARMQDAAPNLAM